MTERIKSIKETSLKSHDIHYSEWDDINHEIRLLLLPKEHKDSPSNHLNSNKTQEGNS